MFFERLSYKVGPCWYVVTLVLGGFPQYLTRVPILYNQCGFTRNTFFHHGSLESWICLEYLPGKGYLCDQFLLKMVTEALIVPRWQRSLCCQEVLTGWIKYILCDSTEKGLLETYSWLLPNFTPYALCLCWLCSVHFTVISHHHGCKYMVSLLSHPSKLLNWRVVLVDPSTITLWLHPTYFYI